MSVTAIEAETLRHMKGKEGLIIQGCGGGFVAACLPVCGV